MDDGARAGSKQREVGVAVCNPYRCEWCGETYVVPSLARKCEQKHESQT